MLRGKNLFGSTTKNFAELLLELFWSLQVYRKNTVTKSHDYSRLFYLEKRRLKMGINFEASFFSCQGLR